uniref:Uncharacterized protein n=1 Tax=Eutreptiella gymnastica TaxID=73025 RepID=A0A7S1HXF0_9EUGL|mmetsp:Transcript_112612/g.195593  ORF Transcript_112612/g.195593 Transcript_112612/m.195593 type:complete len:308 (+) Transcript_112612:30-953(+)
MSAGPLNPTQTGRLLWVSFAVLYFMYLSPVFVAFFVELSSEFKAVKPLASVTGLHVPMAYWLATIVALYILLRLLGKFVPIKMHKKSLAKHKEDILQMLYFGTAQAVISGAAARVASGQVNYMTGLSFLPLLSVFTLYYTLLFEVVRDCKFTLSSDLVSNLPALITFIVSFAVIVGVVISHLLQAWAQPSDFREPYFWWSGITVFIHAVLFLPGFPGIRDRSYLHLHHWYWPLPLAHFAVFPTDISLIAQALFTGIHIHGIACFGAETLFYDDLLRARRPSLFEWTMKPDFSLEVETSVNMSKEKRR